MHFPWDETKVYYHLPSCKLSDLQKDPAQTGRSEQSEEGRGGDNIIKATDLRIKKNIIIN